MYSDKLPLNEKKIARCRKIAADIGQEVANLIHRNSTVGTERGILRLLGFNGALTHQGLQYPVANLMLDQLREHERLQEGALFWVANALLAENVSIPQLEEQIATRKLNLGEIKTQDKTKVVKLAKTLAQDSFKRLKSYRELRRKLLKKQGDHLVRNDL